MKFIKCFSIVLLFFCFALPNLSAQPSKVIYKVVKAGITKTTSLIKNSKPVIRATSRSARNANYEFGKEEEPQKSSLPTYSSANSWKYPTTYKTTNNTVDWKKLSKGISKKNSSSSSLESWMRKNSRRN